MGRSASISPSLRDSQSFPYTNRNDCPARQSSLKLEEVRRRFTRRTSIMRYHPSFEEFEKLAARHTMVPVYRQLIGDTLTPVSAFCKVQEGDWAFLFESVIGGERLGRYSFLGAGPFLRFQAFDHRVLILEAAAPPRELEHPDPLRLLEEILSAYR